MNQFVRKLVFKVLLFGFTAMLANYSQAQVFDPNAPVDIYDPSAPPTVPNNALPARWVKTNRFGWNTSSFKAYIYRGIAFRLKFPKNYDASGNTKYPLLLFFHGLGERGPVTDNEYQLLHGGQTHMNAVDNGKFNGFLLYPQTSRDDGGFTTPMRQYIMELIENFLIPQVNVDPFRISVNGLSAGGFNVWAFNEAHPRLVAGVIPISSSSAAHAPTVVSHKFTPYWLFQGGLDQNPPPSVSRALYAQVQAAGANFKYTEYPNEGHGCWNTAWAEADYFPFLMRVNKANPWPVSGRTEFCEFGGPFSTTIGVDDGFDEYQWKKDGIDIAGATSNTITVTSIGSYSCRIRKGSTWSSWSPIPVQIKYTTATIPPSITVSGLASRVLPAPDGKTTVNLEIPPNFLTYIWKKVGNDDSVYSTTNSLQGVGVGSYTVQATEPYACTSTWSTPFEVINANGPNKPSAPSNLLAIPMSFTSVKLAWTGDASNPNAPTNFEIYQATQAGGPYTFAAIVSASTFSFIKEGLTPGNKYYFIVRAVNNTAGSGNSNEASANTLSDTEPPTAPGNLKVGSSTRTAVSLNWEEASDNVGVRQYEIFVNGIKSYVTTSTEYTVYNLQYGTKYNIAVRAVDVAGNTSPLSNQVTAQPFSNGLSYKHYSGSWTTLPNFNLLTPIATGMVANVNIDNRLQNENYAYIWQGYIKLPPANGAYRFSIVSNDGARLYLSEYDFANTPLVNNDGVHGQQEQTGTTNNLTGGTVLPITITYFQKNSGNAISVRWRPPGTSSYVTIPDSAFVEAPQASAGTKPTRPGSLVANAVSYNKVNLTWADNSNNETRFEVARSTEAADGFHTVAVLPANTTSYSDTLVAPNTLYYYKVRAINQYGESAYDKFGPGVQYGYYERVNLANLPNFSAMMPAATGVVNSFVLGPQLRNDNFAMRYESVITLASGGTYTFFTSSDDGSKLAIDGQYVVYNDYLQGTTERSGTINLSAGVHSIVVEFFEAGGGEVLEVRYSGPGISKQLIPAAVLGEQPVSVTTGAAPPAPQVPSALNATGISSSSIRVNWTYANTANATSLELYRSFNDNQNYVLLATLPATTKMYLDTALYPSSLFFYKIRAVGVGGASDYTAEKSTRSLGVIPSITPIEDVYMRFNSQFKVPVEATSGTPTSISLSINNKPAFAQFDSIANGKSLLTFNPVESNQGTYTIVVVAKNAQGNTYTSQFKLTVNANYVPDIATIANQSVNEKQTKSVVVNATDNDASDVLSWSLGSNTPSFVSINGNNRQATISLAPGYSDAGAYKVLVVVNDGRNGKDTVSFNVTVVDVPTNGNDGTAPTKVKDLTGSFNTGLNAVRLTWTNTAYNALRNEVYRSTSVSGAYTLLNPAATNKDSIGYTDNTAYGNATYFYSIKTVNNNGSESSSIVQVSTLNRAPVISLSSEDVFVKALTPTNVTVNVTDDPGETITTSISGLPSFATFTPSGNGSGTLVLSPGNSNIGVFSATINSKDNFGKTASKTIKITVNSSYYATTYINFTSAADPAVGGIWNDIRPTLNGSSATPAGYTVSNLKDETGVATGMNCELTDYWVIMREGAISGNNSGIYPDEVMAKGYYTNLSVGTRRIKLKNLSATKKYNLIFFGNRTTGSEHRTTYTVGSETVTLNTTGNTSNTVRINGVSPTSSEIEIVIAGIAGTGTKYMVINSLVVESYDAVVVTPPVNFKVNFSTRNSIKLTWTNNVPTATGFEVWRSDAANGTYTQMPGTIASNVLSYTNTGLSSGATYYYKVRSILPSGFSEFSDVVKGSTTLYSVSVNFNDGSNYGPAAAAPWNNTNTVVYEGFAMSNLLSDASQPTGIDMTVVGSLNSFSGTNRQDNTLTTGDNSGFVPDVVMSTFYFLEYTHVGKLKISGLNKSLKYNFIFFAACKDRGRSQVTTYTIGSENVQLDAKNNTSNFASINNVIPDDDGTALISLTPSAQGGFGYIGSLIIQAVPSDGSGSSGRKADAASSTAATGAGSLVALNNDSQNERANILVGAYPNPVVDDITLKFSLKKPEPRAIVVVRDMVGKPVYTKTLDNLPAGESNQKIGINGRRLTPGLYSIQVEVLSNNERAIITVVK